MSAAGTAFEPGRKNDMGAARMKKLSLVIVAAGLMALAACNKQTPAENAIDNQAAALENQADALDNAADYASNEATESALENASDAAENAADAVEDKK